MDGINLNALLSQLLLGIINGSFYALLSLGLAVIFGMMNVVNFAHGALYMTGAVLAVVLANGLGIGFWGSLIIVPLIVATFGVAVEVLLLRRLQGLDHLYGLLLTFGLALVIEGLFRYQFGASGQPAATPEILAGRSRILDSEGKLIMMLPHYRVFVVAASALLCLITWYLIERTRLGSYLRAATENRRLTQAFGINVPVMVTLTYAGGVALAGFAGVLATPLQAVQPSMGSGIIIIVFAVVVIGGMGSILGSIITGYVLGILEGLTKVLMPEASNIVVFVIMILVLLIRPAGLFGRA